MSKHHCWKNLRRLICAATVYGVASVAYCLTPASAAEDTVTAAKTDTNYSVSELLSVAKATDASVGAEPLVNDKTASSQGGAEPLSLLQATTETVVADYALADLQNDDEIYDLILGVQRKSDILSNTMLSLQKGLQYYIPIGELARTLNLPTTVDLQNQRVSGYVLKLENTYQIDLQQNSYTVRGETAALPQDSIIIHETQPGQQDVYITIDALNLVWPLMLELNYSDLSVAIKTPRKLPYELEKQRQQEQENLLNKDGSDPDLNLTYIPSGYRWLGPQTLQLSERLSWDNSAESLSNNLIVSGRGDMLGASADYTINALSDKDKALDLKNLRFLLTRKGYGNNKTLPLGLKEVKAGDVIARHSPIIANSFTGRGVYVSSKSNERSSNFDQVTVDGTGQPGWEVEIYRYSELLDFGFIDASGRYRFDDIPLQYGNNEFKIVLYGPQGQIEERIENYQIKGNTLKPGETNFEAGAVDLNIPLFNIDNIKINSKNKGWAQFLRVNRGINHWVSGFATATNTPTVDGDKRYLSAGADISAFEGAGRVEAFKQIDGGVALDGSFSRAFAGVNTTLKASIFNDFESREVGFDDRAKTHETSVRGFKNFEIGDTNLNLSSSVSHTKYKDGDSDTSISNNQSLGFDNLNLTHNINTELDDLSHLTTDGSLSASTRIGDRWTARGSLDYNAYPTAELDFTRLNLRYSDRDKFSSNLDITQGIKDTDDTRVSLNASYDFGTFLGGTTVAWDRDGGTDVFLTANTTFGPDGDDQRYIATTKYKGYTTSLEARLYEDLNKDGLFTEGTDVPAEGIRLRVNRFKTDPSNEDGIINMIGAGPPGAVSITLDRDSMPDPFLIGVNDGYSTVLRPGTKPLINFPLYPSGSIDGTVLNANGDYMSGMIVQLLDQNGVLVQEVPTLFEGFYVFEYVKPGTYIVQVSPSHQVNVPPKTVMVTSEDLFAYGVDLILLEQATEVSATDLSVRDNGRVAHTYHAQVADGTLKPAPSSSDGQFDTVVRAVRIGEHPYKVRLVLDLSEPTTYKITSENDGHIINIDLPSTAWDATRSWKLDKHPMFKDCGVFSIDGGSGTRLRLVGRKPVKIFYNASIPAENGLPDRMYVDFLKSK